ncbi:hypothetical protein Pint_05645 [Pistacia integerrima]|uniref:Uncharacterized protein n=1 Tax=Pistacia integerrima TaxID=434235 RepID=A0ACC0Z7T6_9ROSI|nr:hypothetical protein Pint_05645 [Pistacia integerrima]
MKTPLITGWVLLSRIYFGKEKIIRMVKKYVDLKLWLNYG